MGVSATQSSDEGGGSVERSAPLFAYTEKFNEVFPYYLAIGMTYEQFWEMDCDLVKAYQKAAKIRRDMANQSAWLQGMYFYDALCCVAPAFNAFKPKKPTKYRSQPYEFEFQAEKKHPKTKEAIAKQEMQDNKAKAMMEIFAVSFNKRFEKGGDSNAGKH